MHDLAKRSDHGILSNKDEFKLDGHKPRVRQYARVTIGRGSEMLIRKSWNQIKDSNCNTYFNKNDGDAVEQHKWKCIHIVNGIWIFEDVAYHKGGKVGVVDTSLDAVFELVIIHEKSYRNEWDMLTSDLELV